MVTTAPPSPSRPDERAGGRRGLFGSSDVRRGAGGLAVPGVLVLLFTLFAVMSPQIFFTGTNLRVMITGQAIALLLALAATIPLRAGDFDLSISSVMIMSGVIVGVLTGHGVSPGVAYLLAIASGVAVALVNALFVVVFGIDGLIVTLGMLTILTGLAGFLADNQIVTTIPEGLQSFVTLPFLGLPLVVWIGWALAVVAWYVFEFTPIGRYLLFVGGNRNSAKLAGLRVTALRFGAFIVAGSLSALAGLLLAGTLGSIDPTSGHAYLLPPFTAAFLGASAIQLGRFNIVGTVTGLYLLAVGITGLQLLGVESWIAEVFNGACLIIAVGFSRLLRARST